NCSDFAYFSFTHKRTTFDVFALMGGQTDMEALLPAFLKDFWYVFLIAIAFVVILHLFYKKLAQRYILNLEGETLTKKTVLIRSGLMIVFTGLVVIGFRGGLQLIPIGIVNAGDHVTSDKIPLVLNTPFSMIRSAELNSFEEKTYFSESECIKLFDPCKMNKDTVAFTPLNVVVIILEGFSKEYTGISFKEKSYTPFLDSLMEEGYLFINGYSNGKRSIEGIPAILSSTPSLHEPYLNTIYSNNKIQSLATLLKKKGYNTSFYHGGTNGTMNFDSYCKMAGFERYYGRKEYNDDKDYDGTWGIWDEPFLQRYAVELGKMKQPFLSSVFTLSSHHPFVVPEKYKQSFPEGPLPVHKSIMYSDFALKRFFESVRKEKWFTNTLFVITADHTGPSADPFYANQAGNYQIPVLFYQPGTSFKAIDSTVIQQTDIMPGILSYMHYDLPYFALGNDPFDKGTDHFAVNSYNNLCQFFYNNYLIEYNESTDKARWFKVGNAEWSEMVKAPHDSIANVALKKQKAFLQTYNNSLIKNGMVCE
ncbi:MAG TPA: LTA synthase family protein, partial [Bacteroidia bacterium]